MNTEDLLWEYGNWLVSQGLLKTVYDTPDDTRGLTQLAIDFLKEKNL